MDTAKSFLVFLLVLINWNEVVVADTNINEIDLEEIKDLFENYTNSLLERITKLETVMKKQQQEQEVLINELKVNFTKQMQEQIHHGKVQGNKKDDLQSTASKPAPIQSSTTSSSDITVPSSFIVTPSLVSRMSKAEKTSSSDSIPSSVSKTPTPKPSSGSTSQSSTKTDKDGNENDPDSETTQDDPSEATNSDTSQSSTKTDKDGNENDPDSETTQDDPSEAINSDASTPAVNSGVDSDTEDGSSIHSIFSIGVAVLVLLIAGFGLYMAYQYRFQIRSWIISKEQQVQEQIQQRTSSTNGSATNGSNGRAKGKKYHLLPQNVHDTMHND